MILRARPGDVVARIARSAAAHRMPIEAFGVAIATAVALALRAPFAMRRLWAEDGAIFLEQASSRGIARSFGQAYAGYYLFVPRVIGAFASAVPVPDAALATWLGVAFVVGWCAAIIYVESAEWLAARPSRLVLAFSIVLLPALGFEAIASSSTLQFTLLFASLVALTGTSSTRWSSMNRVAIVTVTALTTPLALVLAPIAALRVLLCRPRRVDATTAAWGIATAFQLGLILVERPARNVGAQANSARIMTTYVHEVLYTNLLPKQIASSTVAPYATFVGACLVLLAALLSWRRSRRGAVLLLLVPATGFGFWTFVTINSGSSARYLVFPALCVIWSALVACEELLRALRPRRPIDWRLTSVVMVLFALSWVTYWRPSRGRASGPLWSTSVSSADRRCLSQRLGTVAIAISPVTPRGRWKVEVPCDELLER